MAVRRPLAPLPVESVEYVLDCLEHGIGAAEVQGDMPDILDELVLAIPEGLGPRGVEAVLAFNLLAQQRLGDALGYRRLERVDARGVRMISGRSGICPAWRTSS